MKHVLLLPFLSMGILPANNRLDNASNHLTEPKVLSIGSTAANQPDPESEKMLAVTFRSQDVCRAELKDFPFDIQYNIVSATVYFSGTNFRGVETGYITSASLKPIKNLMARCAPGTLVIFDKVKVVGPDKEIRTIQGTSYMLR